MHQPEPGTIFSDVDKILILFKRNKERGRDLILRTEAPSFKSEVKNRDNSEFGGDFIYMGNSFVIAKKRLFTLFFSKEKHEASDLKKDVSFWG